jgi:phosphoglycerate transporter family protein
MTQLNSMNSTALAETPTLESVQIDKNTPTNLTVNQRYKYWRLRILYSMIFGYAAFYLVRQNFSMALPVLSAEYGYSKTQLGGILTIWSVIYGVGKFVNGYFSDRSNARYFMSIGLLGAALTSCLMGFGTSIYYFGFLWAINAWFQSMGWPPVTRLLTQWFSPAELGTKWALASTAHQIGGAAIVLLAGFLIQRWGWQSAFIVPGLMVMGIGAFLFNRLRDTPQSIGLPSIEAHQGLVGIEEEAEEEHLPPRELIMRVLNNRLLWCVCFANMFFYIVRIGILNWAPTFLRELKGASLLSSGWQVAGFDIAGIFGGIAAGWISDRFFTGRRGPVSVIYMVLLVICLFCLWYVPEGNQALSAITMMILGFLVYGPQVLAGVASADTVSKKAVGLAHGLTGTFAYVGTGFSGICVGWLADHYGWNGGFIFFIISAFLSTFFFSLTWNHRAQALVRQTPEDTE